MNDTIGNMYSCTEARQLINEAVSQAVESVKHELDGETDQFERNDYPPSRRGRGYRGFRCRGGYRSRGGYNRGAVKGTRPRNIANCEQFRNKMEDSNMKGRCVWKIPLSIQGYELESSFLIINDSVTGQSHKNILIGCNILRKMKDEFSLGGSFWSRILGNMSNMSVRTADVSNLSMVHGKWEMRILADHMFKAKSTQIFPCILIGPDFSGIELAYWEDTTAKRRICGTTVVLTDAHKSGSTAGQILLTGGYSANPHTSQRITTQ